MDPAANKSRWYYRKSSIPKVEMGEELMNVGPRRSWTGDVLHVLETNHQRGWETELGKLQEKNDWKIKSRFSWRIKNLEPEKRKMCSFQWN